MFSHIILYVLIEILPIWTAKEKEFTGVEMGDINENLLREVDVGEEIIDSDDKVSLKDKLWIEMKKMWIVAGPAMFNRLSTFGLNVITQAFVGHIGSTELAAYAYVYTVIVRLANGVLVCLSIKWFGFSLIIIYIC